MLLLQILQKSKVCSEIEVVKLQRNIIYNLDIPMFLAIMPL